MINKGTSPGPELVRGYDPGSLPLRLLKRQWRDVQTHFPRARAAKYDLFNFGTRRFGLFADPEMRLLARLAPVGLAIDVGGNWGQTVHALRRYLRPRHIITLEPNPELATRLASRFPPGSGVEVRQLALGHGADTATLHIPRYRDYPMDGLASLDRAAAHGWLNGYRMARFDPAKLTVDAWSVEVQPLDALQLDPAIIKIDVQGTETAVAMGGMDTINRARPIIIVERPDDMFIHLVGAAGLAPYRWNGKNLLAGDLTGKNTLFLTQDHVAALNR